MTDNQIKECLSEGFLRIILAHNKFKVYESKYDHGVDLVVAPVEKITSANGEITFEDSDLRLDVQLKCTTTKYAKEKDGYIEYNLRQKNYMTLKRKVDSPYLKMILILLVLPEDEATWINVLEDEMLFKKQCFWYFPNNSIVPPEVLIKSKDASVKIQIPKGQHLLKDFTIIYNNVYAK